MHIFTHALIMRMRMASGQCPLGTAIFKGNLVNILTHITKYMAQGKFYKVNTIGIVQEKERESSENESNERE